MTRIIIQGCNGKMGQVLAASAAARPDIQVTAGIDMYPEAKENPFPVFVSFKDCTEPCDVVIDFSVPQAVKPLLKEAVKRETPVIIATTGLSQEELDYIKECSEYIPIFRAANMSVGINLMYELVQKSASVLGKNFDIEIIEKHHNQKIDSPSGTAYAIADAINEVFVHPRSYVFGRYSKNKKRSPSEIGIHAIRGGTLAGEHEVMFAGSDEVLEIVHRAHSKQIFAEGALAAALYLKDKPPGIYNMRDMMTEKSTVTNLYVSNQEAMITINNLPDDPVVIAGIFKRIGDEYVSIDIISQTAPVNGKLNISFTIPEKDLKKLIHLIEELNRNYPDIKLNIFRDISKLTVEGVGMERQFGVAAKVFELMAERNIRIKTISTSETKISYVINQSDESEAVQAIVKAFKL